MSKRIRYLRKFTIACNTPFQGIAADGAKAAFVEVFNQCFFDPRSPLAGCYPVLFIHDEIVLECDESKDLTRAAHHLCKIMKEQMEIYTPDIPAIVEPCVSREWTKGAHSKLIDGKLTIYGG